jgi:hypothetical protein
MQICPINREWIHNNLVEPYLQGCELINLAWKGIDRSLAPNPLSLKERVIYWLQGSALIIPFVNLIFWLAWQTFGKPAKLFDPYCPETPPPPQRIAPPAAPVAPIGQIAAARLGGAAMIHPPEVFSFNETCNDNTLSTNWRIEHFAEGIVVHQNCENFTSTSVYRPALTLKEYHYQMGPETVDLTQNGPEGSPIHLRIIEPGKAPVERIVELEERIPWIQQRGFGFRSFVQSNDRQLRFYAIVPKIPSFLNHVPFLARAPFVMPAIATKIGEENIPGFGRLLKIEIVSAWRWPYNSAKSELWYDIATGQLRKFIDTGTFISTRTGEFVPQNQLPV